MQSEYRLSDHGPNALPSALGRLCGTWRPSARSARAARPELALESRQRPVHLHAFALQGPHRQQRLRGGTRDTLRSLAIIWLRGRIGLLAQFSSSFLRRGLLGSFSSAFNLSALSESHQQFLCIRLGPANQFHPQSAGAALCVIWQKVASSCRLSPLKASSALRASLSILGSFHLVLESKCAAPTRPFLATGKTRTRLLAIFVATRHLSAACNDLLQGE